MSDYDSDSSVQTVISITSTSSDQTVKSDFEAKMSGNSIIGNIEFFSPGDDFKMYMERMTEMLKLNKVEEDEKISFLIGVCGADLYKVMKSVVAPKSPSELKFDELKKLLDEYFEPKRNIISERFLFHRRQQKPEETVCDYIVEIKSLSQTCDFGTFLEQALRDKLVFGVCNTKIQARLVNEKDLTFDSACSIAKTMEMTQQNLEEMKNTEGAVAAIGRGRKEQNSRGQRSTVFSRLSRENGSNTEKKKRYSGFTCHLCGKIGHVVKNCYQNPNAKRNKNNIRSASDEQEQEDGIGYINNVLAAGPVLMEVCINNINVKMELDSGACKTVIHLRDKMKYFPNVEMRDFNQNLYAVSGQRIDITGYINVTVRSLIGENRTHECELIVIQSARTFLPLLGRNWLDVVYSSWRDKLQINAIKSEQKCFDKKRFVESLRNRFPVVFSSISQGTIKHFKAKLFLAENAKPIFFKPYTVPYGQRESVENEIKRLCDLGIIYPVRHSEWASPIVVVNKPDGSIRMCVDCKVTINKYLKNDHYPLPRIDDILASLAKAKYFCVLDLREAYAQMEVEEESQEYLTINTHLGLFRYRRLIFGVSSAPTTFQSMMDQIIMGLILVVCFIDDLLIGGETFEECMENLIRVLERLNEYNVKIKLEKCKFFEKSVTYLGHEISGEGIRPNKQKVEAIMNAPRPQNVTQVKSFLGLINYYGRFLPNLSNELISLYKLTQKNMHFEWSDECENAFQKSKNLLLTNNLLVHYDPNKPIVIHCDASPYGLGAILSHVINGKDMPVLFVSCTLTKTQQNYAQLHREALAIVFAVKRFHKYIFGKEFIIYSDHQPLKEIFNESKSIPVAAGRLQRWAVYLAMYDYHMKYRKGNKMCNADALSRLPLKETNDIEPQNIHAFGETVPINVAMVANHTQRDKILGQIYNQILNGWNCADDEIIKPYYNKRLMLSTENGCIFYGNRIVIPEAIKTNILQLLHDTHVGICRMKTLARLYVWWMNIDRDIEKYANQCNACQLTQSSPSKVALSKWKETTKFFERIHIDFFHFKNHTFLLLVDSFSRWFDAHMMKTTTSAKLIAVLRSIFAYFGLPSIIVSDNGPPFNSKEFITFCENNGIDCLKSPPYHPQSNGWAECGVRTIKQSLRKMILENKGAQIELLLARFLMKYRNTPTTTTGKSPSEFIFRYRPKTILDILTSKTPIREHPYSQQVTSTKQHSQPMKSSLKYKENELVLYRHEFKNELKWLKAKIISILSECRYRILLTTKNSMRNCHGDQLRPYNKNEFYAQLPVTVPLNFQSDDRENIERQERREESNIERARDEVQTQQFEDMEPTTSDLRRSDRLKNKSHPNYKESRIRPIFRKRNITYK